MQIDELFNQIQASKSLTELSFPENWCQGRTAFGGLSAALVYVAMRKRVASERVLRSMNTNFVGPLIADTPFEISVEIVREGKNSSMVLAKAIQNGNVCVMVQACFAIARSSKIEVLSDAALTLPTPQPEKNMPYVKGLVPEFLQHIDLNVLEGQLPFTDSKCSTLAGWMRFSQQAKTITDAHIIALIDAWPPTTLQMADVPSPASSMTWNLEFIHPHSTIEPDQYLAYKCITRQAGAGYAHTEANVWNANGELIAISRQCVTVFA